MSKTRLYASWLGDISTQPEETVHYDEVHEINFYSALNLLSVGEYICADCSERITALIKAEFSLEV